MVRAFVFYFILLLLYSCGRTPVNSDVPVVHIDPDAAKSFVVSDFFDGYEVLTFKGIICTEIGDFVHIKDKILASSVVRLGFLDSIMICVFDTTGQYLYPLGTVGRGAGEYVDISKYIELTGDTTVFIKSITGWLEYDTSGKLLREKRMVNSSSEIWGTMQWRINDTTLLFVSSTDDVENRSKAPGIQLVSVNDFRVKHSFFPLQLAKDYITNDQFYALNDTVCIYADMESCIYRILEDTVLPRYVLDKGKYAVLSSRPKQINPGKIWWLPKSLRLKTLSENTRYLIGKYLLDETYYFFLYDKHLGKTYNLKSQLEDDLLFGKVTNLFFYWEPGWQISDEYMYFYFTSHKFSQLMESVCKNLNETDWEAYQQKHPDLMKVYRELNEYSNTVVVGYKFK